MSSTPILRRPPTVFETLLQHPTPEVVFTRVDDATARVYTIYACTTDFGESVRQWGRGIPADVLEENLPALHAWAVNRSSRGEIIQW